MTFSSSRIAGPGIVLQPDLRDHEIRLPNCCQALDERIDIMYVLSRCLSEQQ
jgi:hypothetical protein